MIKESVDPISIRPMIQKNDDAYLDERSRISKGRRSCGLRVIEDEIKIKIRITKHLPKDEVLHFSKCSYTTFAAVIKLFERFP